MRKFDFIGTQKIWVTISVVFCALSIFFTATRGLNLGLDFTGGTILERSFSRQVNAQEIRQTLTEPSLAQLQLASSMIQITGGGKDALIRTKALSQSEIHKVDLSLQKAFGKVEEVRTDSVEPVIGKELMRQALLALLLSWALILVYVGFRFEFRFGIAGILALVHDVLITIGTFAVLRQEVNMPFVAAILTIIGFSINDTIVVFDRIRENLRFRKKETLAEIANNSINETLTRSVYANLTVTLTVLAILLFGGATLKEFSLAMFVGCISGTYSSIYIATPIWLWLRNLSDRRRAATRTKPAKATAS